MYFGYWDTGGNPGKLCLWKVSISLRWNYVHWNEECKFKINVWARSVGSWQWRGDTTGFSHICCAHPREALNAANAKVFITLHPLLFITHTRKKNRMRVRPTNRWRGSESRRSRRMKCPHWLAAPLWSPLHSLPIDTWEISSRQRLILVIYSRRHDCAATDDFLSSCSWLTGATRPAYRGQSRTKQPAPPPRSDSSETASKPAAVKPTRPRFLLIISYMIWPTSFD